MALSWHSVGESQSTPRTMTIGLLYLAFHSSEAFCTITSPSMCQRRVSHPSSTSAVWTRDNRWSPPGLSKLLKVATWALLGHICLSLGTQAISSTQPKASTNVTSTCCGYQDGRQPIGANTSMCPAHCLEFQRLYCQFCDFWGCVVCS